MSVTSHLFCSVNGVAADPHLFQFDAFGPEEGELMVGSLGGLTDVVMGATLWREWSEYWPTATDEFGRFINPVRKHVLSSTLTGDLGWNSTPLEGDPVSAVRELAASGHGGVAVVGGVSTVRSLFLGGAIDALTLTVHPAVTSGTRLFDDETPLTRLRLLDSQITSAGNAILTYGLRPVQEG